MATINQTQEDYTGHPDIRALGRRVRYLRTRKGLNQAEMTCSAPTISKVEQGITDIRLTSLIKIADSLGVQLSDLFDFEAERRDRIAELERELASLKGTVGISHPRSRRT